jgi:hypothetical protein
VLESTKNAVLFARKVHHDLTQLGFDLGDRVHSYDVCGIAGFVIRIRYLQITLSGLQF